MSKVHSCEMCGRDIARPIEIEIEGAKLSVCSHCSKHGKRVVKKKPSIKSSTPVRRVQKSRRKTRPTSNKSKRAYRPRDLRSDKELVEDYADQIRLARQRMNISQKDVANKIKISTTDLQSFELGKLRPTDNQIKILEKFYKIKLTENIIDYGLGDQKSSGGVQTLGDIVVIKKNDKEEK